MKILLTLYTLTVVAETVWGCCSPTQWTGIQGVVAGTDNHGVTKSEASSTMVYYDAVNQRIAANSSDGALFVLEDFKAGTLYTVINGSCTVKQIPKQMREACTAPSAQPTINTFFGAGSSKLDVTSYSWTEGAVQVYYTVTTQDCIPVVEVTLGTVNGVNFMQTKGFLGIESGIKDTSVFAVPRSCTKLLQGMMMAQHNHEALG